MAAAIIMTIAGAALTGLIAREAWFHDDAWDFLTNRSFAEPASLLEPHAGHWQTPTVLLYRLLQSTAGMDFYPWYLLPRSIGYALLAFWFWRVLLRRGTTHHTAMAALAVVLVLGAANWHDASTIGNLIVIAAAYRIGLLLVEAPVPTPRDRWLLLGLLVLALMSSSLGVAVTGATVAAALLTRSRRQWLPPAAAAVAVYGLWYVSFRIGAASSPPLAVDELVRLPEVFVRIFGNAIRIFIDAPMPVGVGVAVVATIGFIWLGLRRRLDPFDHVLLLTAVAFVSMVLIVRLASGSAQISAARYAHNVTFMVLPVLIPRLAPERSGKVAWVVTMALLVSLPGNFSFLVRGTDFWEQRGKSSSQVVETAAALLADGEPALSSSAVDPPRTGVLTVAGLQRLLGGGWEPVASVDPDTVALARANLRFGLRPGSRVGGDAPQTLSSLDDAGCAELAAADQLMAVVQDAGTVALDSSVNTTAVITWLDEWGSAQRTVSLGDEQRTLELVRPTTSAELRIMVEEGSIRVCGMSPFDA